MRVVLFSVCLSLLSAGCVGSGCNNDDVTFDTCDAPGSAALATLTLERGDGSNTVIDDDQVVAFTYGGQGSPMIGVQLRMTGTVPRCLAQTSEIRGFDDELIEFDRFARTTYDQGDGTHTTKSIFLVMSEQHYGAFVRLVVTAGGMTVERHIYLDSDEVADATGPNAPDAPFPDAGLVDASLFDAAAGDATISDAAVDDAAPSP